MSRIKGPVPPGSRDQGAGPAGPPKRNRSHGSPRLEEVDIDGAIDSYRANQPVFPVRSRPADEDRFGPQKPQPGESAINRPRYGSGLIERPSETMESFAARMDVSVEELESSIEDGSFRQLLADSGVEARLGILINMHL